MQYEYDLDLTRFRQAVHYVFENTHRALSDIINRAALVSIIGGKGVQGAMQRTPQAAREKILAVPIKEVAGRLHNKFGGQKFRRDVFNDMIKKEYKRRVAASGYTARVGWNKAAIDLGGHGIGKEASGKGYATLGYGKLATAGNLEAVAVNTAPAASIIGAKPLQQAIDDAARDMVEFWGGKAEEVFRSV